MHPTSDEYWPPNERTESKPIGLDCRVIMGGAGTLCGASVACVVWAERARGFNALLLFVLAGAVLGMLCGIRIPPLIARAVTPLIARAVIRLTPDRSFPPPPRKVLITGAVLGAAEGILIGAALGELIVAVF